MNRRTLIIIQIFLALVTFAGSVYVSITPANSLMQWYNIDDAFYYYKVAQNILTGHGISFDHINLSNGFHPLWMVVCLGVFWLSEINLLLPLRVLVIVSGLFNAVTAVLLFQFLKRYIHLGAALCGALIWGLYPPIFNTVITHGMESAISIFFIVLLLSMAAKLLNNENGNPIRIRDMVWLGIIGGLTILARLDNIFVVALIGVFVLFKIKKIPVTVIFDLIAVSVSVFLAWIIRMGSAGITQNTYTIYPMLMISVFIKPVFLYFSGCYLSTKSLNRFQVAVRVALASIAAFLFEYFLLASLYKLGVTKMFSNSIVIIDAVIGFVFVLAIHLLLLKSLPVSSRNPFSSLGVWIKENWRRTLQRGLAFGLPIVLLVGGYMIFNKLTFGTFTPVSGQIKHWWSTMINTVYGRPITLISVLGLGVDQSNGPWSIVTSKLFDYSDAIAKAFVGMNAELIFGVLIVIVFVLFLMLMRAQKGRLARKLFTMMIPALIIGSMIHITYYTSTGYTHTRSWYWIPEMLTLVVIGSLVLDGIFSWMDSQKFKVKVSTLLVILFVIFISITHYRYITNYAPYHIPRESEAAYLSETREVEFYTKPGSKIGMTGGGMVAYFIQDRTVVNLDGLINSTEYFNAMKTGKATQFLDNIPLNYAYGKPYMLLESDPYDEILKDRLVEIGYIRGYEGFTLFEYVINQ